MTRRLCRLLIPVAVAALCLVSPGGAQAQADDVTCESVTADTVGSASTTPSVPLELLGAARAQALVAAAAPRGPAVRVAVVDSGILDSPRLPVVERQSFTGLSELRYFHGTAVAGLIAGRPRPGGLLVGMDASAELVDVRVYDEPEPRDDLAVGVDPGRVAQGLQWVADNADRLQIGVVNVSLAVPRDSRVEAAVAALRRADVLVVAASGNRPRQEGDPFFDQFAVRTGDEDAAAVIFPAGYPGVVAVNATSADPGVDDRDSVLQNSATDLAAPTAGAVSVGLNGAPCVIAEVATSWSTAEVSGVAALLRRRFPSDTAGQIAARLMATAGGSPTARGPMLGAGLVQPVAALTRALPASPAQSSLQPEAGGHRPATAPDVRRDPLPALRRRAWLWSLLAGSVLVLALLARPLLVRRRSG